MWDSLLDKIRDWMIVRFALNTDRDLWGWLFVIGAAAHLEHLAFIVLWIADQRPVPFEKYRPKRINSLGQAVDTIQTGGLLDPTTVETLTRVNRLRNSVLPFAQIWR